MQIEDFIGLLYCLKYELQHYSFHVPYYFDNKDFDTLIKCDKCGSLAWNHHREAVKRLINE